MRHACRVLIRSPWYTLTVTGVIALSMALATTVFAVVDGVLFKPLPYDRPADLYNLSGGYSPELAAKVPNAVPQRSGLAISKNDIVRLADAIPEARVALVSGATAGAEVGDLRAWAPRMAAVSENFLDTLGIRPLVGGFSSEDFANAPGDRPLLVTYSAWQTRFGGRADIVGHQFQPDPRVSVTYRIAGVLPRGFVFPSPSGDVDGLQPLIATGSAAQQRRYSGIVRLPPGSDVAAFQRRSNAVFAAIRAELPPSTVNGGLGHWDLGTLTPFPTYLQGARSQQYFWIVMAAVGALVLLACLNVSGLVTSRNLDRASEISVRRALGAGHRHIAGLVLAESGLLTLAGVAVGVAVSPLLLSVVRTVLPDRLALLRDPSVDLRVLAFAALAAAFAVMTISMWPVVHSLRQRVSRPRIRGRLVIITAQVALGLALTTGGGLVFGSLVNIWNTDVGFNAQNLLIVEGSLEGDLSPALEKLEVDAMREALQAIPGVLHVGTTSVGLLRRGAPGGMWRAATYQVDGSFQQALGLRVLDGRWMTEAEVASEADVVVLSAGMAASEFPDQRAVGQWLESPRGDRYQVVGVVDDARLASWTSRGLGYGEVYRPLSRMRNFSFVIRTAPGAPDVLTRFTQISDARPAVIPRTGALATELLSNTVRSQRFQAWLFGAFAVAALVIVGVGLLGLNAMATARRGRELGIRVALGATPQRLVRLLVREQMLAVGVGLMLGAVMSIWTVTFVESYLHELSPHDVRVWVAAIAVVTLTSAGGALLPSWRAASVNPVNALRTE